MRRIPAKTGAMVMPVVVTPEGEWLQDTTHIVDVLEQRFPDAPVLPATPRQRIVAELLEMWADEWWIPAAMHYRWSFPENYLLFEADAGNASSEAHTSELKSLMRLSYAVICLQKK